MEKRDWYIQGWQHDKFYPDFIVKTKAQNYIIVEYKGENLLTNEDTNYKKELGERWAYLAGEKYHFILANKNNIDEVIKEIQKL